MWATIKKWAEPYVMLGEVIATTLFLVGFASWLAVHLRHHQVGAWTLVVEGAISLALLALISWWAYRKRKALPPTTAERAIAELEVAKNYLVHVRNFMEGLRFAGVGLPPAEAIPKLQALRDLLFDAIIQEINAAPGEHIRCALFEPRMEGNETVLRVRMHRGHTHRVENLVLHMNSVAGIAMTTRESIYIHDPTDPRVERTEAGRTIGTLYCLPLYTFNANQQDPVGVLSVTSNHADAFSDADRTFIASCADMIGVVEFFIGLWEGVQRITDAAEAARGSALAQAAAGPSPDLAEAQAAAELPAAEASDAAPEEESDA